MNSRGLSVARRSETHGGQKFEFNPKAVEPRGSAIWRVESLHLESPNLIVGADPCVRPCRISHGELSSGWFLGGSGLVCPPLSHLPSNQGSFPPATRAHTQVRPYTEK